MLWLSVAWLIVLAGNRRRLFICLCCGFFSQMSGTSLTGYYLRYRPFTSLDPPPSSLFPFPFPYLLVQGMPQTNLLLQQNSHRRRNNRPTIPKPPQRHNRHNKLDWSHNLRPARRSRRSSSLVPNFGFGNVLYVCYLDCFDCCSKQDWCCRTGEGSYCYYLFS